jgi:hypothetical protein
VRGHLAVEETMDQMIVLLIALAGGIVEEDMDVPLALSEVPTTLTLAVVD